MSNGVTAKPGRIEGELAKLNVTMPATSGKNYLKGESVIVVNVKKEFIPLESLLST